MAKHDVVDLLSRLGAVYEALDATLDGFGCDASTDCCRFGVTGREPYVTRLELALLDRELRARGGLPKRKRLSVSGERRCPLLGDDGRCAVYSARPFGCRTFFCDKALADHAPTKFPRREVGGLLRELTALAESFDPRDGRGAPLTRALGEGPVERVPKPRY